MLDKEKRKEEELDCTESKLSRARIKPFEMKVMVDGKNVKKK